MKRKKLLLFATSFVVLFALASCDNSSNEPEVSWSETKVNTYYPNFGGSPTVHVLYDANRLCYTSKIQCFRVTKTGSIIATSDECDACGKSWFNHKKK